MNDFSSDLSLFASIFFSNLPKLIVCVIGIFMVLGRRQQLAGASTWALLGFGLFSVICFLGPATQVLIQHWMRETGDYKKSALLFGGLGFFWSVMNAVATVMLLLAIIGGRTKPATLPGQM